MTQPSGPLRDRLNAWFLGAADDVMDRVYGRRKRALFADLPPTVVELGPGAGANLRYYPPGTKLIAYEPNRAAHRRLRRAAAKRGVELDLRDRPAETLDLPDASADAVVSTLVLCTVDNPARVLAEVRRVLRPGGRFLFVEHVAGPAGSPVRAVQRLIRHPWRWLFEGCCVDRDTAATLEAAGFASLELERFRLGLPSPIQPHVAGRAVR
jgi:SAM-dependent methyltransferase